jgi:hypothetical protein
MGICTGLDSMFVEGTNSIFLTRVSRTGNVFAFRFESDASGIIDKPLTFYRQLSDKEFATDYAEAYELNWVDQLPRDDTPCSLNPTATDPDEYKTSLESLDSLYLLDSLVLENCSQQPSWFAFLVTGNLADLAAVIANGQALVGVRPLEPGTIRNIAGGYVRSINIANADRTRATAPNDCRTACLPFETGQYYVRGHCLQGDIRFVEGYNCAIRMNARANSLTFTASVGAGAGEVCAEVPLFNCEPLQVPAGALLTGGPSCNSTIRSINGVGGSIVELLTGLGINVTPVSGDNRLIIDVNMQGLNAVTNPADFTITEPTPPSYSDNPCDCGPQ